MDNPIRMAALGGAAVLALAAGAAPAQDLTKFTFGTNWVAQAEHGGYYQAVVDGTYEACGLDVEIVPGGPQVNGRALMIAGKMDAYMGGNMIQPWNAISEGIPIVVVGANFQKEPQVVMTHPGRVASMEEMAAEGLEVLTDDGANLSWYKILINRYGFKEENRGVYTYNSAPFIADKDKAQQGYVTSEPYAIEQATGWAPDVWLLADYGYIGYSTTIEMMKPFVDANPKLVECFVDGTAKGWYNYLYGDNAAANAMIQEDNPDMSDGQIAFSIDALKKYGIADSGDALDLGINAMTDAYMKEIFDTFVGLGLVDGDLDFKAAYTLDFVNKGAGLDIRKELVGE